MLKSLIPCRFYNTIFDINISNLERLKIKYYFFDFDNTLMPWQSETISDKVSRFLMKLQENNKKIIVASNGKGERYDRLKNQLPVGIDVLQGLGKPRSGKLIKYILDNKIDTNASVFIGDNLITDIYTANKLGMYTIKVKPIAFREFWATKMFRVLEIVIYIIFRKKFKEIYEKSNPNW